MLDIGVKKYDEEELLVKIDSEKYIFFYLFVEILFSKKISKLILIYTDIIDKLVEFVEKLNCKQFLGRGFKELM